MRHAPIDRSLFVENRQRLTQRLAANSLAVVHANDVLPTNADGTLPLVPNSDLFYLTGIEQEESILLLAPNAAEEKQREILFLRESNEKLAVWEGHKLTKDEAREVSGVENVKWLSEFPALFHSLICEAEHVYLNSNEHRRAHVEVESRDARFIRRCQQAYPLHDYRRLAPLLHQLRVAKLPVEIDLLREAIRITDRAFRRVARFVRPGVMEYEIEAEFAHEFVRSRARFAYTPIVASGANSCVLHYIANDQPCAAGQVLLLDVAANYANYNADLTRTLPVDGRFTPRQRQVYDAVLRVMRFGIETAVVGKLYRDWLRETQAMMDEELLALGLLNRDDIEAATQDEPACRKYFMHGLGHPLGLDVHDVGPMSQPFAAGWVLTVEPGIYIPDEGFGIRLENNVLVDPRGPIDLMADIPVEAEAIEALMHSPP